MTSEKRMLRVIEFFDGEPRLAGCLPRKTRPGQLCPLWSEHFDEMTDAELAEFVGKTSLRNHVKTVLDQDGYGSCATESSTQSVMVDRAVRGLPHVVLNAWFVYRVTSGGRDSGSSIDENLGFIRENGIAPENLHPRSLGPFAKPSHEAIQAALDYRIKEFWDVTTVRQMRTALAKGFGVVWGSNGHSVLKVADLGPEKGLDVNSWAPGWGDHGFGVWAPYSSINWAYGCWAIRVAAPSGAEPAPEPKE